jgi:serine/threonine protein kinase
VATDSSSTSDVRAEPSVERKGPHSVGEVLGATYRIVRKIGAGGMADVYEVEHLRLGSRFAAKIPRATGDDESVLRRFQREARLVASLRSDHIVVVFDVSEPDAEPPFMLMELLNGQDLRRLLKIHAALSVERTVKIGLDVCAGLAVVHAAGIVHRDLKPENLFLVHRDSGEELCKLLDFGVIKAAQATSTQHGALVGTIRYMAPEQIENAGRVTPQSDVRSLGSILYECLTGKPAFDADSTERLMYQVLNGQPVPVRALRPEVPEGLDATVMRALERDPLRRFPSVRAFADALRPFSGEGGSLSGEGARTQVDSAPARSRKDGGWRREPRVFLGGGCLAIAALGWAFAARTPAKSADSSPLLGAEMAPRTPERAEPGPLPVTRLEAPLSLPAAVIATSAVPPETSSRPPAARNVAQPTSGQSSSQPRKRGPRPASSSAPPNEPPKGAGSREPTRLRIDAEDPYAR